MADRNVIGRDGRMPWHLPADLAYFRARTIGKPVIMGRKTWVSLGKALPRRTNIVLTRDRGFAAPGAVVVHSFDAALAVARQHAATAGAAEIMVIGGAEIYTQALPAADRIYLTRIALTVAGDTVFPVIDPALWRLVASAPLDHDADDHSPSATTNVFERTR